MPAAPRCSRTCSTATDYDEQVELISAAFRDSCREIDEHPLMGARAA